MSTANEPEPGIAREKRAWRRTLRRLFALVPPESRARLDSILVERVGGWLADLRPSSLLAYAPLPDEPDLFPAFRAWLAGGGVLGLPAWLGGDRMVFRRVSDPDRDLRQSRRGIREPLPDLPEMAPETAGAAILPGRAFSESLDRLGRGAGCYDAGFGRPGPLLAGAAYDFQVFPRLPAGRGDVPVDLLLTPTRTLRRKRCPPP
jgi:5-formyltetrahydrofolate cyclo-ligase